MSIGRIEISRIPVTVWLFVILMSYAPLITHAVFPWFDYSDKYYTVHFADDTFMKTAQDLANNGGIVGTLGQIVYGLGMAVKMLMMLMEGVVTGFMPTWKLLGLDQTVNGLNVAVVLSGMVYMFYAWTIFKAYSGGLRV